MKKTIFIQISFIALLLFLTFCSKDQGLEIVETNDNIAEMISSDPAWIELSANNYMFIDRTVTILKSKINKLDNLNTIDENMITDYLGYSDQEINTYAVSILNNIKILDSKYNLQKLNPSQIEKLTCDLSNYSMREVKSAGICEDQFEEAFDDLHATYDSGVKLCAIVTLATGGGGFIPCNAVNIYKACMSAAEAIDEYNACIDN
jgi:hypothetical protein